MYNQTKVCGNFKPFIMGITRPNAIEVENEIQQSVYDPIKQVIPIDFRVLGTKSLKTSQTRKKVNNITSSTIDRANEIDDRKNI